MYFATLVLINLLVCSQVTSQNPTTQKNQTTRLLFIDWSFTWVTQDVWSFNYFIQLIFAVLFSILAYQFSGNLSPVKSGRECCLWRGQMFSHGRNGFPVYPVKTSQSSHKNMIRITELNIALSSNPALLACSSLKANRSLDQQWRIISFHSFLSKIHRSAVSTAT